MIHVTGLPTALSEVFSQTQVSYLVDTDHEDSSLSLQALFSNNRSAT